MKKQELIKKIIGLLNKEYKDVKTGLYYRNAFEILIATILSSQCTDNQVNKVTKILFKKYRNVNQLASAELKDLESIVYSTGFYKNKARNIKRCAESIKENFKGRVPDSIEKLVMLPGVGRKTANVVLSSAFKKNQGIVVDTHVKRLSFRIGLTDEKNPEKIEIDLMKITDIKDYNLISLVLIFHGRKICKSRSPKCDKCIINKYCRKRI